MGLLANSDGINKAKTRPRANLLRRTATDLRVTKAAINANIPAQTATVVSTTSGEAELPRASLGKLPLFTVTFNIWLVTLPLFVRLPDT